MTSLPISSEQAEPLLGAGRTADVFLVEEKKVLKLYKSFISAETVEREFLVTQTAHQAGLPVPQAYEIIRRQDRYGILFERIQGISLLGAIQRHPTQLIALATQLAELHVRLNSLPAPQNPPRQYDQILSDIEHSNSLTAEKKARIVHLLDALPQGEVLCHGDFHPDNVLLTDHGPIVIDWMTGTRGNACADFVRTLMIMGTSALPKQIPPLQRALLTLFRNTLVGTYRSQYLKRNPQALHDLFVWQIPLLAARLMEVSDYPDEKALILKRIDQLLEKTHAA
jgi:Predicted aminoglycoside phosphotransferase